MLEEDCLATPGASFSPPWYVSSSCHSLCTFGFTVLNNFIAGELYHKGLDITYGIRCLLVCFTDGFSPKILDDSKAENDDPAYEKNTVLYGGN